ncbi:Hint domain-containing protein [Litoreibacter halocynthiae]|uniref:Hint domain-containing protein n=1 Tax=Litoreibacter halocynthiae TaxID=1242689 RepID=A0A4R7LTX3_9RHOB|nr:Hint domain-containing protein [Litoreibacter halocynthiae]TDT77720.1 Hint domain-containing protein [Litoreibacter halocynthiae]
MTTTTSDFIYIGNFADMDTNEGDWDTENPNLVLGVHDDLVITTLTQVDGNNDGLINDDEAGNPNDYVGYDVGNGTTTQWVDSTSEYNAIVTLGDGTQMVIELVVIQTQAGDVFVADLYNRTDLDAKAIQSVELTSLKASNYGSYYSEQGVSGTSVVCFAAGTAIHGAQGPVRVENIQPEDKIWTLDRGFQPVRNIMRRALLRPDHNAPVRIAKGALCQGIPRRTLFVSPQHRVLLTTRVAKNMLGDSDVLIAAKHLIGLDGITQQLPFLPVSYTHLLFDRHEIILANGAAVESLLTGAQTRRILAASGLPPDPMRPARTVLEGPRARRLIARHLANRTPRQEPLARNLRQESFTIV